MTKSNILKYLLNKIKTNVLFDGDFAHLEISFEKSEIHYILTLWYCKYISLFFIKKIDLKNSKTNPVLEN